MLIVTMFTAFRDFSLVKVEYLHPLLITVNETSDAAVRDRQKRMPAARYGRRT